MQVTTCLLLQFSNCKKKSAWQIGLLIIVLLALPALPRAGTLTLTVANGAGGAIAIDASGKSCRSKCGSSFAAATQTSLLAEPDQGYRFQRWFGACASTIGPLCTLRLTKSGKVTALFTKTPAAKPPVKALLLLHDEDDKPAVWNRFIERYFGWQCPTIYGGVVLDQDGANPQNNVHCYRIAFGYYRTENSKLTTTVERQTSASGQKLLSQQVNEIKAAVLGIKQRHPDLRLTLVSASSANPAARVFWKSSVNQQPVRVALLTLQPQDTLPVNRHPNTPDEDGPVVDVSASPRQVTKINAALMQTTGSWWLSK